MHSFHSDQVELICVSDDEKLPDIIDAEIIEEDTWQVLAADTTARDLDEHPIRLMTSLIDQKPLSPGEVVIKGKQWRAVIYDLDEDPPCNREWTRKALERIHHLLKKQNIDNISVSLPGIRYGCLEWRPSLALVLSELAISPGNKTLKIWLQIPRNRMTDVTRELALHYPADQ